MGEMKSSMVFRTGKTLAGLVSAFDSDHVLTKMLGARDPERVSKFSSPAWEVSQMRAKVFLGKDKSVHASQKQLLRVTVSSTPGGLSLAWELGIRPIGKAEGLSYEFAL
jgi:hypothetical protein